MIQRKHGNPGKNVIYYLKSTYSKVSAQFINKVYGFQELSIFNQHLLQSVFLHYALPGEYKVVTWCGVLV